MAAVVVLAPKTALNVVEAGAAAVSDADGAAEAGAAELVPKLKRPPAAAGAAAAGAAAAGAAEVPS